MWQWISSLNAEAIVLKSGACVIVSGYRKCDTLSLTSFTLTPTGRINGMSVSADGLLLCTTSDDKALKIFDVINFGEHSISMHYYSL